MALSLRPFLRPATAFQGLTIRVADSGGRSTLGGWIPTVVSDALLTVLQAIGITFTPGIQAGLLSTLAAAVIVSVAQSALLLSVIVLLEDEERSSCLRYPGTRRAARNPSDVQPRRARRVEDHEECRRRCQELWVSASATICAGARASMNLNDERFRPAAMAINALFFLRVGLTTDVDVFKWTGVGGALFSAGAAGWFAAKIHAARPSAR